MLETKIERQKVRHKGDVCRRGTLRDTCRTLHYPIDVFNLKKKKGFPITLGWAVLVAGGSLIQKYRTQKKNGFETLI